MRSYQRLTTLAIALSLTLSSFVFTPTVLAAPELIKAQGLDTVYYLDEAGTRHAFPNLATYQSWYGTDFSKVVSLSAQAVAQYPLGKNVTIRPGTQLVKVPSAPQVYAVEQGGVLRQLQTPEVAQALYGSNWPVRVVDIPEAFFGNYTLGEPLTRPDTLPDSILLQDEQDKDYYYLRNGLLQRFASPAAVLANGFRLTDALVGKAANYAIRPRPIKALDKNIFNPVAASLADSRDCSHTSLTAAFLFLAKDFYTQAQVEKVELVRTNSPAYFSWATRELSNLDTKLPTAVMLDDGYLLRNRGDGTTEINNEALLTFYDNHPDIYDFIFVFTNFEIPNNEEHGRVAYFVPVSNKQQGIGRVSQNRGSSYGSTGKLKGVIVMGNVAQYSLDQPVDLDRTLAVVAHEILHQWGAYVAYGQDGFYQYDLMREDRSHWSNYATFLSPLGGSGWIDNGDGTFTSGLLFIDANKKQYSDLDLYLMGALPKQVISPLTLLIPENPGEVGNVIKATTKQVTIDQIIRALGSHQCND